MDTPIKVLIKNICPHCKKEILVEVESPMPSVKWVLAPSEIEKAKEDVTKSVLDAYQSKKITEDKMTDALKWISEDDTVFGPNEVNDIINSIIN